MIRWEYNTIEMDDTISNAVPHLDAAGADGWDVVHVHVGAFGVTYLMKRPVLPPAEQGVPEVKHNHSVRFMCGRNCPQYGTANENTGY